MVVAVGHAIVAGIFEVVVPIGPAVCLKWRATRHVAHAAPARLVYILVGPCIPVLPVGVVGVNPSAVQIVQFVCFKVVWRFYFNYFAVQRLHVICQPHDACVSGNVVVAVAPAKGEPADALVVDDYSRIEGSFTLAESWSITVYHTFAQWVCPGPHGGSGSQHTYTGTAVGVVQIEVGFAVGLLARSDGRCPRSHSPGSQSLYIDYSVISPVHHVVRRDHRQRMDVLIGVFPVTAHYIILLVVVSAVHINAAVVHHCCGVGHVLEVEKGIGIAGRELGREFKRFFQSAVCRNRNVFRRGNAVCPEGG